MEKVEIIEALHSGVCEIKFEKADRSIREMKATLISAFIKYTSKGSGREDPEDIVTVWDVEADGFRRFKISKLIEFNGEKVC